MKKVFADMDEGKRLIKNTIIIAIGNIGTKIISLLMLPFYTSYLDSGQFGLYDYLVLIAFFLIPISTCLIDESLFRFLIDAASEKEKSAIISNATIAEGIIIGTFSFLSLAISCLLDDMIYFYVVLYVISVAISNLINPILRGTGRYIDYAIFNASMSILFTIFSVFFVVFCGYKVEGLFIANILAHCIVTIYFAVYINFFDYVSVTDFSKKEIVRMLAYSFPLIPSRVASVSVELLNRVFIINMLGTSFAGIFALAYKLPLVINTMYGFFCISWQESAARMISTDLAVGFYSDVYKKVNAILKSVSLLVLALTPFVFRYFINDRFFEATKYVPILLLSTYLGCGSLFWAGILTAYKKTKSIGVCTLIGTFVNIGSLFLLIKVCGEYGTVFSILLGSIVTYWMLMLKVNKILAFKIKDNNLLITFFSTFLVVGAYVADKQYLQFIGVFVAIAYSTFCLKSVGLYEIVLSKISSHRCGK